MEAQNNEGESFEEQTEEQDSNDFGFFDDDSFSREIANLLF